MVQSQDCYSTFVQLVVHAESTSWNRFYNYLMAIAFLTMAWATLYVSAKDSIMVTVILIFICAIGFLMGLSWPAVVIEGGVSCMSAPLKQKGWRRIRLLGIPSSRMDLLP